MAAYDFRAELERADTILRSHAMLVCALYVALPFMPDGEQREAVKAVIKATRGTCLAEPETFQASDFRVGSQDAGDFA